MLVSTTRELIEKLQDYERRNGVGAIRSIGFYEQGNRKNNYILKIANDSFRGQFENNSDGHFCEEIIETSAVDDESLFPYKT